MSEQKQEQKEFTKEEVVAQLKDAIEVQELQTRLQQLRTQLVMARYDEVRYMQAFQEMTEKPEGAPKMPEDNKKELKHEGKPISKESKAH